MPLFWEDAEEWTSYQGEELKLLIEILTIKNENKIEVLVISKLSLFKWLSYNMTNFEVAFKKKKEDNDDSNNNKTRQNN